ncbi:zinc finger protein 253-like isoform X2 [Bacillus rossius redtenbacheri]|uniref:zinc finger protein 253-like isoform X2 n=1 Tax=Bacillus rossius redtenbacheri TaxID=93214 RepID=UPI002FDE2CD7
MWSDTTLNFSSSVCRLCANSSEIVIPIFGKVTDKERMDLKIKKCLPIIEVDCSKAAEVLSLRPARGWPEELARGDPVTVQHDGGVIVLGKVDGEAREECQDFVLMVELKYKDPLEVSLDGKAPSGLYVPDPGEMGGRTLAYAVDGAEGDAALGGFTLADCQDKTRALIYAAQPEQLVAAEAGKTDTDSYTVEFTTAQPDAHGSKLQQLLTYATVQQGTPVVVARAQVLPKTLNEVIEEANIAAKEMAFSTKDDAALDGLESGSMLLDTNKFKSSATETEAAAADKPKKPFPCSVCSKSFMRRTNLNAHLARHAQVRPHACEECGKSFCARWDLTLHRRIHAGLFACQHCGKAFAAHAKLKRHVLTHTGERPFPCATCGRAFGDKRNLQTHQRVHTGERPFPCETCGRSFRVRSHLLDHRRVHTREAPFTCDVCGKSFKWKTNLNIHLKTHSGEHHSCADCGREFTRRSELAKHERVHAGARPHVCDVCGKSYAERGVLLKHAKLHGDRKPYGCDVCGKSFHYRWYLISHKKMHAEEKTGNACEFCGKVFDKKGNLAAHSKCCHTLTQPVTVV